MQELGRAWADAGVQLVQYRDKQSATDDVLQRALKLRRILPHALLILNDHIHLVEAAGFDGAHVGQNDAGVRKARQAIGTERLLGISTHSIGQVSAAAEQDVDYVAIGPVFATQSKTDAEPVVGLAGVTEARLQTTHPLVAIGGIGLEQARQVRQAGADSVAIISGLLPVAHSPEIFTRHAQDILARLK